MHPNKVTLPHSSWVAGLLISVMFMGSTLLTPLYLFSSAAFAILIPTGLREFPTGSVFPDHPYALERRRDRGALLFVLFRLWFFLLAIASQLALCHLGLLRLRLIRRLDRLRTTSVHVERSSGALDDLLRDHELLGTLKAG